MRLATPCLLLCLLVGCLGTMAHAATSAATSEYVALGDSVAFGVGASAPSATYVNTVFRYLNGASPGAVSSGVNLSKSSETASSFRSSGQLQSAIAEINDPTTDIVVVTLTIGGNDILNLLKPGQPCENPQSAGCRPAITLVLNNFATDYSAIVQQLTEALAADPGVDRLLVMTYYNPFSGVGGAAAAYEQVTDLALLGSDGVVNCAVISPADDRVGINDMITCIGQFYGVTLVDVYPLFKNRAALLTHIGDVPPDIHPNDAGHAAIAQAFIVRLTNRVLLPLFLNRK